MSRSYKKSPCFTDGSPGVTKEKKRIANKKVRNTEDLPTRGKAYKKVSDSYDIHDYTGRWTWEEAKSEWEREVNTYLKRKYPTLKAFYRYWLKCCKTK
jgi:hypothetical protein